MNTIDELCCMLDERGVEYETYIEQPTGFEHVKWNFNEHGSADFNLEFGEPWLTMYGTISGPEQAIAATLGSSNCTNDERTGTCHADETDTWECVCDQIGRYGKCVTIHVMECSECGRTYEHVNGDYEYCPHCGAEVVDG